MKDRLTLHQVVLDQVTADGQGWIPLAILAGSVLVLPPQSIPLVTVVLDSRTLGNAMAGGRVAGVAAILWCARWSTSYRFKNKINTKKKNKSLIYRPSARSEYYSHVTQIIG